MFRWPHHQLTLGGYRVHCVHVRSEQADAPALVLTHGWPGTFLEMLPLVPRLRDFHLVIPSLIGFGFSPHPGTPGCNSFVMAELWVALMAALGYERFYAQGGDFGASVSTILGWRHTPHLLGVHLNYIPSSYQPWLAPGEAVTEEETAAQQASRQWEEDSGAYAHVQRTEPQTLSYGLQDSPAGLAAWLLQRFRDWSDCGGDLTARFPLDDLLAQVTLYWLTGSIGSSMRLYGETARRPLHMAAGERVAAPCAIAHFPLETPFPPRRWVERGYHVVRWTEMPRGGHFAALEEPDLLAGDVREFAASPRAD